MHCIQRGMWWFTEGKQCTVSREGCCGGVLKESNASFCPVAVSREGCCGLLKESNALYPERDVVVVY